MFYDAQDGRTDGRHIAPYPRLLDDDMSFMQIITAIIIIIIISPAGL